MAEVKGWGQAREKHTNCETLARRVCLDGQNKLWPGEFVSEALADELTLKLWLDEFVSTARNKLQGGAGKIT